MQRRPRLLKTGMVRRCARPKAYAVFSAPVRKIGKKPGKNAKKCLHFPESMIYYLFITLRKQGCPLHFRS